MESLKKDFGGAHCFVECDTTNPEHLQRAIRICVETFGRFDVMCNNVRFSAPFRRF